MDSATEVLKRTIQIIDTLISKQHIMHAYADMQGIDRASFRGQLLPAIEQRSLPRLDALGLAIPKHMQHFWIYVLTPVQATGYIIDMMESKLVDANKTTFTTGWLPVPTDYVQIGITGTTIDQEQPSKPLHRAHWVRGVD